MSQQSSNQSGSQNVYRLCSASRVANTDKSIPECECTVVCSICNFRNNTTNDNICYHSSFKEANFTFKCDTLVKLARCKYKDMIFVYNPNLLTTMIQLGYMNYTQEYEECIIKKVTIDRLQLKPYFKRSASKTFICNVVNLFLSLYPNTTNDDEKIYIIICLYDFLFRNAHFLIKADKFKSVIINKIHDLLESQRLLPTSETVLKKVGTSVYDLFIENWLPQLINL